MKSMATNLMHAIHGRQHSKINPIEFAHYINTQNDTLEIHSKHKILQILFPDSSTAYVTHCGQTLIVEAIG